MTQQFHSQVIYSKEIETHIKKKNFYKKVQNSFIHFSPKLETA